MSKIFLNFEAAVVGVLLHLAEGDQLAAGEVAAGAEDAPVHAGLLMPPVLLVDHLHLAAPEAALVLDVLDHHPGQGGPGLPHGQPARVALKLLVL